MNTEITNNKVTISGIELEAVRFKSPIPHWRAKVVKTGEVIEAGVFKSNSRPAMWESARHIASLIGEARWVRDMSNS